jgi:hypothetical protein
MITLNRFQVRNTVRLLKTNENIISDNIEQIQGQKYSQTNLQKYFKKRYRYGIKIEFM